MKYRMWTASPRVGPGSLGAGCRRQQPRSRCVKIAMVVAGQLLWSAPIAAAGQCADLNGRINANTQTAVSLAQNNPGSATVFGSCLAVGTGSYSDDHDAGNAMKVFAGCAGIGCIVTDSYSNCLEVNLKMFALALRNTQLSTERDNDQCPSQ